jgi:hypothetical protein
LPKCRRGHQDKKKIKKELTNWIFHQTSSSTLVSGEIELRLVLGNSIIAGEPFRPATTRNDSSAHSITVAEVNFDKANVLVTLSGQQTDLPKFDLKNFERFNMICMLISTTKNTNTTRILLTSKSGISLLLITE